jgi:hypothetical protein
MPGFGGETKETDHLEDLDAEGRIILKHILIKTDWLGVDWICLGLEKDVTGSCEHGDKLSGSVKLQELLLHKEKTFPLGLSQSVRYLAS